MVESTAPDTVQFDLFDHAEDVSCREPGYSQLPERPDRDVCPMCRESLEHVETIDVDLSIPDPDPHIEELIEQLSDYECTLLLGMTMESLTHSWDSILDRLVIIVAICNRGVGEYLDDELLDHILSTVRGQVCRLRAPYQRPDGTVFDNSRFGSYELVWDALEEEGKDERTMRYLSTYIPNDMWFDASTFRSEFVNN